MLIYPTTVLIQRDIPALYYTDASPVSQSTFSNTLWKNIREYYLWGYLNIILKVLVVPVVPLRLLVDAPMV